MNFEVYCDESGLEALKRKDAHNFMAIGSVWMPESCRDEFKEEIKRIKIKYNIAGELKWHKFSPAYFDLYSEIIDYFFQKDYLRFRVLLVESAKVDNFRFNSSDAELGFYKFYYQLLHHWIYDFNEYHIFLDHKVNRDKGRLKLLEKVLRLSNLSSKVEHVQGLPSDESLGIQLADILTGLTAAKFNGETSSKSKLALIKHIEVKWLHKEISPTPKWEEKFNVFKINLQGGW